MWTFILKILLQVASSKAVETAIAVGVNKLLESKDSGVGKDLANTMINGIAKSKLNPTTNDVFKDALQALNK